MEDTKVPFLPGTDESPLAGVSDYRGRPVYRSTSGGWRSALFVVVLEVASGFAFYGVQANLIMFLTGPLGHSNAAAAMAVNAWVGTASIMPLLGAFVADSWLGRYRSIILAFTLYVLVMSIVLAPSATVD
ncbi:protein NRT1/ PTR FAMILY 5.10-like [Triticum dicoccoides]|uniref:protein NRT1/ PTR FAMILY 5.10-like n=1 Tax=Triticum dicoccoides TaxID=85692 RepID=UPI00188E3632|nr:protein NRT1/ PTR FAMILY 5.10-like [Triticum dicoccoides]XP_037471824.1 protein NRT1/ PTR FAMILY 5.10-like [Triticum dicoccoides]